jgi:vitamin B12 transporter
MNRCPKLSYRGGLIVLAACFMLPQAASAMDQSTDELAALEMFFDDSQLFETATRSPKPLNQIAENVAIITADQIEAMNAHTVADVLKRVGGLFGDTNGEPFGGISILIHAAEYEHILVLVDGLRWGYVSADLADVTSIPVQIVKRIEVIKGAASSTWGSSLGGVINIITKDTGNSTTPHGTLFGLVGEYGTGMYGLEAVGRLGKFSYYLYGGQDESDGIRIQRFHDNGSLYGKLRFDLPCHAILGLTAGYSNPEQRYFYYDAWDDTGIINDRALFYTASLDLPLSDSITATFSAYRMEDSLTDSWLTYSSSSVYYKRTDDEQSQGANGRLTWSTDDHTVVVGAEIVRRESTSSDGLTGYEAAELEEENWAVYANDTIQMGDLTVTPGLRYDHLSLVDDIFSPSIGLVYRLQSNTLLRASATHGFRKPPAAHLIGDPAFFLTNQDLESEKIWSYQAGLESAALGFARIKTTLFFHDVSDEWDRNTTTWAYENNGSFKRKGVEMEVATIPWHHLTLVANGTHVRLEPDGETPGDHSNAKLTIQYDDEQSWTAQLFGQWNWWDSDNTPAGASPPSRWDAEYGRFVWDFNLTRKIKLNNDRQLELLFAVHNIFEGEKHEQIVFPYTDRWVEGGLRFRF